MVYIPLPPDFTPEEYGWRRAYDPPEDTPPDLGLFFRPQPAQPEMEILDIFERRAERLYAFFYPQPVGEDFPGDHETVTGAQITVLHNRLRYGNNT